MRRFELKCIKTHRSALGRIEVLNLVFSMTFSGSEATGMRSRVELHILGALFRFVVELLDLRRIWGERVPDRKFDSIYGDG